jgi:L-lactate dehydrogenase
LARSPVLRWDDPDPPGLSGAERDGLLGQVIGVGYEIVRGKGYTSCAIALAVVRIIEAVLYDEHQVLPFSSLPV